MSIYRGSSNGRTRYGVARSCRVRSEWTLGLGRWKRTSFVSDLRIHSTPSVEGLEGMLTRVNWLTPPVATAPARDPTRNDMDVETKNLVRSSFPTIVPIRKNASKLEFTSIINTSGTSKARSNRRKQKSPTWLVSPGMELHHRILQAGNHLRIQRLGDLPYARDRQRLTQDHVHALGGSFQRNGVVAHVFWLNR